MFLHQFKYSFLRMTRMKTVLFWTLLFPIALATFMYAAFGNIFENEELFHEIPVAIVKEQKNESFDMVMNNLGSGDDALLHLVQSDDIENAKKLLEEEKVKGIYLVNDEISLTVGSSGIEQTILNEVLTQYQRNFHVIKETEEKNPQAVAKVMETLQGEVEVCKEKAISHGNQDNLANYFYAIFAMSCLFAGMSGVEKATGMQANTSPVGMRRCLAPRSKMSAILADFSASLIIQFFFEVIAFIYMSCVLKVDFGDKIPAIMFLLLMGCTIGISIGFIIGCIPTKTENEKISILTAVSMVMSVLADLVISGMRDLIEHNVPIINRINPASLIVDSFYSLNVYDTYDRFLMNMSILGGMAAVLLVISYLLVRRVRYANL